MTHISFGRIIAAGLMAGIAWPVWAQTVVPSAIETSPLPPLAGDPAAPPPASPDERAAESNVLPEVVEVLARDPIAEAVTAVLAEDGAKGFAGKRREAAVQNFYADRAGKPAWVNDAGVTARAEDVVRRLSLADTDALDPSALAIPTPPVGRSPAELAQFEIALSRAVIAFAEEASGGRVQPSSINSKFITRKPERVDPIEALAAVADAIDVAATLEGFNPPHDGFRRLKVMLADVRGRPAEPAPEPIPEGKTLKPGMSDPRVSLLRQRLDVPAAVVEPVSPTPAPTATGTPQLEVDDPASTGAVGVIAPVDDVYDDALVEAVKTFQRGAGLVADGIVGPRTLAVLNGVDRDEEGQIVANMEMWRWMPRDLGADHVFVNIPEFMVRVFRHGAQIHEARVVVGTQVNQTPVFSDEMEYLVVNPYWHVPESIRMKEMLPLIKADPAGYFRRHGYEAVWNGQVINPASVLWDENAIKYVAIRQPPSEANALGRIKFMFPNAHAVYLHDTPSRKLFQRDWRAYSHGCVRVDDPMEFARAILESEPDMTVAKLEAMFGGSERRVDLTQHIKVHIGYFNVWVDEQGTLQMRDDIYGHSVAVKKALEKISTASL